MASTNLKMLSRTSNNTYSDKCYTPTEAIEPLLKYLDKDKVYYEATSRTSKNIVNCMRDNGYQCEEGTFDFFNNPHLYDGIITNPPYSIKDKFIEKCYATGKPFALLLPVSAIQGIKRGAMFNKHGIELLVLNKRIDFTGGGSPHFGVAWFCHGILPWRLIFS
jgi:hypothetical protein